MGKSYYKDYIAAGEEETKKKKKNKDDELTDYQRAVKRHNETTFDSVAPPSVQRLDPAFVSKSKSGDNYQWEKDYLSSLPKSYGKSFNDKFDNFAYANGMTSTQADAFRQWLDAGDKMKVSDGYYNQPQETLVQQEVAKVKATDKANKAKDPRKKADEVLAMIQKDNGAGKKGDGVVNDFLRGVDVVNSALGTAYDNTLGRVIDRLSTSATDGIALGQVKKNVDKMPENMTPEFVRQASQAPTNGFDKAVDITGELAGAFAPIGLAYKPAGAAANLITKGITNGGKVDEALRAIGAARGIANPAQWINAGVRGGTAMGLYSGAQQGLDEVINPEDANLQQRLQNVGLNTALGAVGDPVLGALGTGAAQALKSIPDKLGQMAKVDGELPTFSGKVSDNVLDSLAPTQASSVKSSDNLYDFLANGEIPASKAPEGPLKINNWQDKAYPKTENPQINDDIVQQAMKQKQLTDNPEELKALDDLIESITGSRPKNPKADEDAFVAEQMKPHYEAQQKYADAQTQWETTVKNAKDQATKIKGEFGKIYVPKDAMEDYPIPKQFLASSKDKVSDDIFSITDRMGFNSPEELVQFLQVIDADTKTKLKDILPDGAGDTRDLTYLEQKLRKQFREKNTTKPENNSEIVNNSQEADKVLDNLTSPSEPPTTPKIEGQADQSDIDRVKAWMNEEPAANVKPETSSNVDPLGIIAGRSKENDISWIENPPTIREKIESGEISGKKVIQSIKSHTVSDLSFVKEVMKTIAKKDMGKTLQMIGKKMKDVKFEDNLYKGLRSVRRAMNEAIHASKKDYGKILSNLRDAKISKRDFDEYVSAVHFRDILKTEGAKVKRSGEVLQRLEELEKLIEGTNDKKLIDTLQKEVKKLLDEKKELEPYEIPKKATPEAIQRVLDRWEGPNGNPVMIQAQKDFMAAQNKDLDLLVASGVKTQAQADAMRAAHPNYIYMGRADHDITPSNMVGNISKVKDPLKKRGTGSEENLKYNPMESAIRNRMITYHNAQRNSAMSTIEKLAQADGGDMFFTKLNEHTASKSQMENAVKFYKDGQAQYYEVDPLLKQAFDNLDTRQAKDLASKSIRAIQNVIKKGSTHYNLDFILASPFRETNALVTSRTNLHPGELILGYMDSFFGKGLEKASGGLFKSYKSAYKDMGGHYTGYVTTDPRDLSELMKAMNKGSWGKGLEFINPKHWIETFGMGMDHGPKLAEFRSAKNKGYSDKDAMHEAVDVFDYNDLGTTARAVNNYVPYFGPYAKGITRYLQAAKENPGRFFAKNIAYITAPTLGIYAMRFAPWATDEQRTKINNMTEFKKNVTWAIPAPDGKTVWLIPKMHVGAQLFANPVERVLDTMYKQNPKTVEKMINDTGKDLWSNLTPPGSVAGVQLIADTTANYNRLMDMPIEDKKMLKNPDKSQHFNSYTSELAKKLGDISGQSPAKIDYVLKGLTGTAGRDALDVSDNVLAKLGVDRPAKTQTTLDILNPMNRYKLDDSASLGTSDRLRKLSLQNEWDRAKEREKTGEKSLPKNAINKVDDAYAEFNKIIAQIREDKKMGSAEKKKAIAEMRAYQRQIGDELISAGVFRTY